MKTLTDELHDYLASPRTPEAVRVFAVQRRRASSGEVAAALDELERRGDIELFLDRGIARLGWTGTRPEDAGSGATLHALPGAPSPEEAAARKALELLRAIDEKHDALAVLGFQMATERKRIQPDLDRLSVKLAEMKEAKKGLETELECLTDERDGIARVLREELKEGDLFADHEEAGQANRA